MVGNEGCDAVESGIRAKAGYGSGPMRVSVRDAQLPSEATCFDQSSARLLAKPSVRLGTRSESLQFQHHYVTFLGGQKIQPTCTIEFYLRDELYRVPHFPSATSTSWPAPPGHATLEPLEVPYPKASAALPVLDRI